MNAKNASICNMIETKIHKHNYKNILSFEMNKNHKNEKN